MNKYKLKDKNSKTSLFGGFFSGRSNDTVKINNDIKLISKRPKLGEVFKTLDIDRSSRLQQHNKKHSHNSENGIYEEINLETIDAFKNMKTKTDNTFYQTQYLNDAYETYEDEGSYQTDQDEQSPKSVHRLLPPNNTLELKDSISSLNNNNRSNKNSEKDIEIKVYNPAGVLVATRKSSSNKSNLEDSKSFLSEKRQIKVSHITKSESFNHISGTNGAPKIDNHNDNKNFNQRRMVFYLFFSFFF